ncbi:MAG: rane protein, major facilitator superfamily [Firmicutes bacterium]|nr:rane protein, major facilitator superfamily [Bacillota bacterium]
MLTAIVAFGPKPPKFADDVGCQVAEHSDNDFKLAVGHVVTWFCVIGIFINSWANQAFNDLTPGFLAIDAPVDLGMGPMTAGKYMMIYQLAFMVGSVLCGIIMKKVFNGNARPVLLIASVFAAVFALSVKLPLVYSNSTTLLICLVLTGLFLSTINPTIQAFIAMSYPKRITGKVGGMAMGILSLPLV